MTKDATEFTQQKSERAVQAVNLGMDWARELAEQSLNQSKVVLDGLFSPLAGDSSHIKERAKQNEATAQKS
jgi:hypothetical protein